MINIKDTYEALLTIVNKAKKGTSGLSPVDFNRLAPLVVDDLVAYYYGLPQDYQPGRSDARVSYEKTQLITDSLLSQKIAPVDVTIDDKGRFEYPDDYVHYSSLLVKLPLAKDCDEDDIQFRIVPVEMVTDKERSNLLADPIAFPNAKHPIATCYKEYVQVEGLRSRKGEFSYLKYPEKPVLVYTLDAADNLTVDEANSTDIDLPRNLLREFVSGMLGYLGMNMNDQQLVEFSELKKVRGR